MVKTIAIAGSVALAILIGGMVWLTSQSSPDEQFAQCRAGQIAGYTYCPDVCPIEVSRNATAVQILEDDFGSIVKPVFISIDPKRDTPEVMADYTEIMHPRMLGLTGSAEQVKGASQAYRTFYKSHDKGDDEFYLVDHSTLSYLVFPEKGFAEFIRRDEGPEAMAERILCFIDAV